MERKDDLFSSLPSFGNDNDKKIKSHELPTFPEDSPTTTEIAQLSVEEIREIRSLLADYKANRFLMKDKENMQCADPFSNPPPENLNNTSSVISKYNPCTEIVELMIKHLNSYNLSFAHEIDARESIKSILTNISNLSIVVQVWGSILTVFPIRDAIRHGTPEQKLFALNVCGDRFLTAISGLDFPERRSLIKTVSKLLSEVSEYYSFLAMEGEPFSIQLHERVEGAAATGKIVREMRSFLVVRRNSNQVIRLGRVVT